MKKKIGLGIIVILIIIQFFRIDKSAPEVNVKTDFISQTNPPDNIKSILKNACYDCHSFETKYPWYSNVAPISWWVKHHINEGREHLNFSKWGNYPMKKKKHKIEECWEEVEEGEMPLESYLYTHDEAKLSVEEKEVLITWFKSLYTDPKEPEKNETKEVELNNGEKWEANIETTHGIANMNDIVYADFDTDNLEKHIEIAKGLNTEIKGIFSACNMKGEAHEQLHNYILPLVSMCEKYEKTTSIEQAKELNQEIKNRLSKYAEYFQ